MVCDLIDVYGDLRSYRVKLRPCVASNMYIVLVVPRPFRLISSSLASYPGQALGARPAV